MNYLTEEEKRIIVIFYHELAEGESGIKRTCV
jgi:hypothetical protein